MERLMEKHFDGSDFAKLSAAVNAAPDLEPANTYPVSWSVMF